ncbi:hypothetical protein [Devosia riboflavina]
MLRAITFLPLAFVGLLSFATCLFVWHYSGYGFDFTDEGFYLFWLAEPEAYRIHIPVSFFGFVYHPLYQMLHGDVVWLRRANVLITLVGAWVLSVLTLRTLWPQRSASDMILPLVALGLATIALGYFALWWLVMPNYNSLTLQGMFVTFIGALLAESRRSWRSTLGWAGIAVGGWLVFLAKPSTAALLAPCVLFYLLATRKRDGLMLAFTVVLAAVLVLLSAWSMDGSLFRFIERITQSIALLGTLGSGQELGKIFRIDTLPLSTLEYGLAVILALAIIAGAYGLKRWQGMGIVLGSGASFLAVLGLLVLAGLQAPVIRLEASVLIAAPIAGALFACLTGRSGLTALCPHLPFALLLLAAPYIYAFGTNGNYWYQGSAVGFFWVLSAIVLLAPGLSRDVQPERLAPLVLLFQFLTACLLLQGVTHPYRQELSFREPHVAWNLRDQGSVLLSQGFHDYLGTVRRAAAEAGFKAGDNMIDLTGRSPGLLFDLGARSLGQPWLVGAYPGSDALAMASLRTESCEAVAKAWLLVELGGPRSLSVDTVLASWGASLAADYTLAGAFKTAPQAGGFEAQYTQQLFKPARPEGVTVSVCDAKRLGGQDIAHQQEIIR